MDIESALDLLAKMADEAFSEDIMKKGVYELGKIVGDDIEAKIERASTLIALLAMIMYREIKEEELLPLQPIIFDTDGRARFKANRIVEDLLSEGKIDMNELARRGDRYTDEERTQFATLIGYSVDGFTELSYVSGDDIDRSDMIVALKKSGDEIPEGVEIEESDD